MIAPRRLAAALALAAVPVALVFARTPRDTPDNWFQLDACLRAPGPSQQEAQISAMLSTIRLAKGDLRQGSILRPFSVMRRAAKAP